MLRLKGLLVALTLPLACQSPAALYPSGDPAIAPHPFTPELIREANPPGSSVHFRIEQNGEQLQQTMTFLDGTETGTVVESRMASADGSPVGGVQRQESTWIELRDHAAFPAHATTIEDAQVEVPGGMFDCWLYTVDDDSPDASGTRRFWFAQDRPGPPVRMEMEVGGLVVFQMQYAGSGD